MSEAVAILEKRKRALETNICFLKENLEEKRTRFVGAQESLIAANSELIALNDELLKIKGVLA
jgi:chaperonin cofactor prefoldin